MPPFTIINKSFATAGPGIFVGRYNFCNARERVGDRWNIVAQVNQQITFPGGCWIVPDRNRCRTIVSRVAEHFMWHKAAVPERPQQIIDLLYGLPVRGVNMDCIVESVGFFSQSAGKSLPGLFARAVDNVKIDLRHDQGRAPARFSRNSVNIGTGRPVLPFLPPERQAVPAISR